MGIENTGVKCGPIKYINFRNVTIMYSNDILLSEHARYNSNL